MCKYQFRRLKQVNNLYFQRYNNITILIIIDVVKLCVNSSKRTDSKFYLSIIYFYETDLVFTDNRIGVLDSESTEEPIIVLQYNILLLLLNNSFSG